MMVCLMSASYVIRAVVEEKDSRLVELLLVSVKPMALLAGKILAVMAFTFGWLLAMLAGFGVSCGLTAALMGSDVLHRQLSGVLAALPQAVPDVWHLVSLLAVLLVSLALGYLTMSIIGGVAGACCSGMEEAGRGHGTRDAADHGRVSGLLRGRRRALGNGGGICRPVPGAEHFLRAGAVCLRQCVHLAGASVLAYPGGCDLRAAEAGCPGICGPHRPPGQPGKMA